MDTLFTDIENSKRAANAPLAVRMRPQTLDDLIGQEDALGEGTWLRSAIEADTLSSVIFYGPAGTGKTSIAHVIAETTHAHFVEVSAIGGTVADLRREISDADKRLINRGIRTILFVDEIHRFNKSQQDYLLPFVEDGTITLIGATTENPSFEINGALLSRCKVFVLQALSADDLEGLLRRALSDPRGFGGQQIRLEDPELLHLIAVFANGDARSALSTLEMVVLNGEMAADGSVTVTRETLEQCTSKKSLLYDKNGEEHYNLISALHKSMRNSDPDAAVYWLARMLEAGEDPLYVARRLTRFASEDVGLADPHALEIAVAVYQACHLIGMPECSVHLTQAVVYLSLAPKSNALYVAYEQAKKDALRQLAEPVPLVIRNATTNLMAELNYGKGYQYAHDTQEKLTNMQCLPDSLLGREYYVPTEQGVEGRFKARLAQIKQWKQEHKAPKQGK